MYPRLEAIEAAIIAGNHADAYTSLAKEKANYSTQPIERQKYFNFIYARYAFETGQFSEAIKAFKTCDATSSMWLKIKHEHMTMIYGQKAYENKRYHLAAELLSLYYEGVPKTYAAESKRLYFLGLSLFGAKDITQALSVLYQCSLREGLPTVHMTELKFSLAITAKLNELNELARASFEHAKTLYASLPEHQKLLSPVIEKIEKLFANCVS